MADYGEKAADKAQKAIEKRLRAVYQSAYSELKEEFANFVERSRKADESKRKQKEAGLISEEDYKDWLAGQEFIGKQWKAKMDHASDILLRANQEAMNIINNEKMDVFAENANFAAYELEKEANLAFGFGIYDADAVGRLLREQPELLPRKVVNGRKDKAWNQRKIANCVAQGIIQGNSIEKIANRIAKQTSSSNFKAMTRYARTAVTGAQNAGRLETMHRAQGMGIRVKKKWLATLDKRTRDSHARLDGQVQEVDKPFESIYGKIRYPGDPEAHPGDVYNCRCTLEYVYPDFADLAENVERYDQENGEVIDDMTYSEWKEWKNGQQKVDNRPKTAQPRFNWNGIGEEAAKSYEKALAELSEEMPLLHTELGYVGDFREAFGLDNDLDYYDFLDSHSGYDGVGAEFIPGSKFSQKPYILIFDQERNVLSAKEYLKALADIREKNGWHGRQNSFYDAAGGTEATIMHEYGHAIAYDCGLYWGGKNFDKLSRLYYSYTAEDIGKYVTLYATVSPQEMLAEAFVMSHEPRLNNPLITSVMELIKSCRGEK